MLPDFHVLDTRGRRGDRLAILAQALDVKFNCLFDEPQDFVSGLGNGYTSW
ncbi:MAG: hypothetical protein QOH41_2608 [Blastocatellia bacterium]|jgi:hypothetical protein|nr:hypothetical protein [Blastocatellia bacterium]